MKSKTVIERCSDCAGDGWHWSTNEWGERSKVSCYLCTPLYAKKGVKGSGRRRNTYQWDEVSRDRNGNELWWLSKSEKA